MKNFVLFFVLFYANFFGQNIVTIRSFGAKADGINDDSKVFIKAMNFASQNNLKISGEGLTYKLSGEYELKLNNFYLSNMNICFDNKYENQFNIKIICDKVKLENINIDGGRGTYNKNLEQWRVFSKEQGVESIEPVQNNIFYIIATSAQASINVENFSANNIHAQSCLTITTFGEVKLDNLNFNNISNKTFHIYHSFDEGKKQNGKTYLNHAKASDIGILPPKILVGSKYYNTNDGIYMPQSSFNFIVSFGDFFANNINVNNYASTGLTADRNVYFEADNVYISNSADAAYSNNPSGGLWFEACKKAYVKKAVIEIKNRSLKDMEFDNSAVHIYGVNSNILIDEITIVNKGFLNKGIRGSMQGENIVNIKKIDIFGNYKAQAIFFASIDSDPKNTIYFGDVILRNNNMFFDKMKNVIIDNVKGLSKNETIIYHLPITVEKVGILNIAQSNLNQIEASIFSKQIKINKNTKIKKLMY